MDRLSALEAFVAVSQDGSFSGAARRLGRSTALVSRQIQALEQRVGVRLFDRTTRRVSVTEAGRMLLARAGGVLADLEAAELAVSSGASTVRGVLRVNGPTTFGQRYLAPLVPEFLARHPDVRVDVTLSDRFVDLVEEGYDVVVRIAALPDSSLVARRIAPCRRILCASPEYLRRYGIPRRPEDLDRHEVLEYAYSPRLRFRGQARPYTARHAARLTTNDGVVLRDAALAGAGIALLPTFVSGDDLRAGRLQPVLVDALDADTAIYALHSGRRHLPAKTRSFVDFLAERISVPPPWDAGLDRALSSRAKRPAGRAR